MRRSPEFIDDWLQLGKEGDEVQLVDDLYRSTPFVVAAQHERFEEGVIEVLSKLEYELLKMTRFIFSFNFKR